MTAHDSSSREIPWHALLNCPEARVLSASEERELLVELVECRNRILESSPALSAEGGLPATLPGFQSRIREVTSCPAGSDPLVDSLRPVVNRYQQLRSKLALANSRLVAHVAKRYQGRGVPPADLIQEGMCSLLSAIDRFDIQLPTRLATYAIWWIRQGIQRAIAAGAYPVRLNPRQLLRLAQLTEHETEEAEALRRHEAGSGRPASSRARGQPRAPAGRHAPRDLARRTQPARRRHTPCRLVHPR